MMKSTNTGIYSLSHFLMDFLCHYYLFSIIGPLFPGRVLILFLVYNFIAFALQCPIGALCDRFKGKSTVTLAFIMLAAGCTMGFFVFPGNLVGCVAGMIVCAFANAILHAGGCVAVMEPGKTGLIAGGVFISFGALGVGLGDYLGINGILVFPWAFIAMAAIVILINLPVFPASLEKETATGSSSNDREYALLTLCLVAVFVRSYGGFLLPGGFKGLLDPLSDRASYAFMLKMLPSVLGFIGKFAGGFAVVLIARSVKRCEDLRAVNYMYGFLALALSSILLLFAGGNAWLCALGIVLFHSVMPVTLYEIYCIFPKNPGFSLGLTTLLLFAGYLPTCIFSPAGAVRTAILACLMIIGTACLAMGAVLRIKQRRA